MDVSNEKKSAQLERILQCRALHGSETLRALLRFIVTRAIEGQENLKEYVIAAEVFGRASDFNPRIDSVVRVQAGRLRSKLLEYYTTEGRDDEIVISLPKGHYNPVFTYARPDNPFGAHRPSGANGTDGVLESATAYRDLAAVWGNILQTPEPILVVFSNTILYGTRGNGMQLFNSIEEISQNPDLPVSIQNGGENGMGQQMRISHYTGIGEAMGIHLLGDFFAGIHHPYRVKRSLLFTWDDAKIENIVVLGSPAENLFLYDLPQKQDFAFCRVSEESHHPVNAIVNTNLQPGEQEIYQARYYGHSPSQIAEDYAVVSMLKGLNEGKWLVILAGINTYGTQAAAEYVTQPVYIRELISHLNTAPPGTSPKLPDYYQILIKAKISGGVPIHISYVTHHVLEQ
jgi:hypothetical protein